MLHNEQATTQPLGRAAIKDYTMYLLDPQSKRLQMISLYLNPIGRIKQFRIVSYSTFTP